MLPVVSQLQGRKVTDDRGSLSFVNDFDPVKYGIRRLYVVENHRPGFIRAWHGHENESKFVTVVSGAALIALVPIKDAALLEQGAIGAPLVTKHVLSADNPQVLCVPPGYFNGFKNLAENTKIVFFSDRTLEESKGDDIRRNWDAFGYDVWEDNFR